ncbi:MAG: DUF4132 domain-containing protein, partial [Planctomycetaceae bacterium]|nr:DUF4132 domain-containing protein [Planctomycetaceae bacterium]
IAWDRELFFDLLIYETFRKLWLEWRYNLNLASICETVEEFQKQAPLSQGERFVLCLLRTAVTSDPPLGMLTEDQQKLTRMIQDKKYFFLAPSEIWSETVNQDLQEMQENERKQWENLLSHCLKPNGSKPSKGWLTQSTTMVKEIGSDRIKEKFRKWIPLVSAGKAAYRVGNYMSKDEGTLCAIDSRNGSFLKGMMWLIQCLEEPTDLIHLIRDLAMTSYRKLPGVGHRGGFVGNAAVYALSTIGTIEAVGQLAMLKLRVKSRATQKEIEKAFNKSAEALGLSREDIEELGVPTYGLEEVGRLEERLGDYTAQIEVDGSDATLAFSDANGKQLKSVPAKVKSDHQEELKELRQALKDIKGMLPAQRDRIDSMFLAQKSWPVQIWRERYLEHPLVGTIARRLLWNVDDTPVLFIDGEPHDVTGKKINHGKTAEITLWHPINYSVEEIVAWRDRLEELQITQPFKQAFREVYPLTAAEENTRTYSNRFAAHIIRQHQFNALCAARRWQNKLRLMVDDNYAPAEKELPDWGLRAEFWIEGIGDNYGVDTSESGAFLRLVTDQVRFYRTGAAKNLGHASGGGYAMNASGAGENEINEPLPLEEIPALVFSEIMRDVDLFVGVASVGNDPTWQDGGPEGRYRDYWYKYAFGTLQESAKTRRVVLERLIPRLKIASRCHLDERFLYVEGTRHTYKIHLGSGNILISTNDSYLCIVPDARTRLNQDSLYLPFEGDSTLSIILSKAFLLAADDKIKDPTILRQL